MRRSNWRNGAQEKIPPATIFRCDPGPDWQTRARASRRQEARAVTPPTPCDNRPRRAAAPRADREISRISMTRIYIKFLRQWQNRFFLATSLIIVPLDIK